MNDLQQELAQAGHVAPPPGSDALPTDREGAVVSPIPPSQDSQPLSVADVPNIPPPPGDSSPHPHNDFPSQLVCPIIEEPPVVAVTFAIQERDGSVNNRVFERSALL